ncbi:hypothetical protein I7I51_01830 [Histoplasma capsulatum]|uniref:Uncharacterized protein n=1 Tax=Ajellomyces capsulatus TaxID=5037 RepID=A0A8A1MFR4_AJECA|nr:hypothetical protein I7I51_01830 [Histoplasma capsulatum]
MIDTAKPANRLFRGLGIVEGSTAHLDPSPSINLWLEWNFASVSHFKDG